MSSPSYGYSPDFVKKALIKFVEFLVSVFSLRRPGVFSAEFSNIVKPRKSIEFNSRKFTLPSYNGRLLWRCETIFTSEPLIVDWIKTFDSNTIFLDIGANIGLYSHLAKCMNPGFIYCCELDFLNMSLLYESLVLNNFHEDILILPFPASSENSTCNMFYRDLTSGDALQSLNRPTKYSTRFGLSHQFQHLSFSLDYIFSTFKLDYPTHIKIDVDGNDLAVLNGSINLLKNAKEVYFEQDLDDEAQESLNLLLELGFEVKAKFPTTSASNKIVAYNLILIKPS